VLKRIPYVFRRIPEVISKLTGAAAVRPLKTVLSTVTVQAAEPAGWLHLS